MCHLSLYVVFQIEIRVGMYQPYLEDWFKVFPRKNIFVTRLEDYGQNRKSVLNQIFTFLDIGKFVIFTALTVGFLANSVPNIFEYLLL